MAFIPNSNSVIAFQSDPTKLVGTFSVVGNMNASITAFQGGAWVTSLVSTVPSSVQVGASIMGTVPVTQTTSPWIVNVPTSSYIAYQAAGSVLGANIGSVLTIPGKVSALNSISSQMSASSVFTGTSEEVKDFNAIYVTVFADTASATDGLQMQRSSDGVNWDINDVYTIPASTGKTFQVQADARFFRIVYTNSASNQGQMRLQTIYKQGYSKPSSQRPSDAYTNETDLEQMQGFNMIYNGSTWDRSRGVGGATFINAGNSSIISIGGGVQITSVMNTIPSSMMVGASIFGTVPVTQTTSPWVINMPSPSVIAYQLAGSVMAVNTTVTTGPSSVQLLSTSASIAVLVNNQLSGVSSVQLMSTSASIVTLVSNQLTGVGSVQLMSTSASIAVAQSTNPWVIGSIVGTYQEDQGATTSDKGLFVLHVRNDTMSSVTNADLDYSALSVGPVGEMITANSPITKWFSQTASVMYGTSVQVVAPPGASIFSYITGIHVMNESANFSRVTISQGLGAVAASILTRVPAPTSGGSNSNYINGIRVLDNNGISASISGVSSVLVTITGFTSKT